MHSACPLQNWQPHPGRRPNTNNKGGEHIAFAERIEIENSS